MDFDAFVSWLLNCLELCAACRFVILVDLAEPLAAVQQLENEDASPQSCGPKLTAGFWPSRIGIDSIVAGNNPKNPDAWPLKSGYFEDLYTPAIPAI